MLRVLIEKLQKRFSVLSEDECEVPLDVSEGHFAVVAMKGSERQRFVAKIACLNDPSFRRLLERAEQEYGFEQTGTLVVPCRPQELEKILMS